MIAVLFADPGGIYGRLDLALPLGELAPLGETLDVWAPPRDARLYPGPHPVVAHPPCAPWCRLAGLREAVHGLRRGEDGHKFEAALAAVRRWGGVLEHPAHSAAWKHYDLLRPDRAGGWSDPDEHGGRSCHVEQGRYGFPTPKPTWLYAVAGELPELRWGRSRQGSARLARPRMIGGLYGQKGRAGVKADSRPRIRGKAASATPPAFARELLRIAAGTKRKTPPAGEARGVRAGAGSGQGGRSGSGSSSSGDA
jgi:hypothetical protein